MSEDEEDKKTYSVEVIYTSTKTVLIEVEASSAAEASDLARETVEDAESSEDELEWDSVSDEFEVGFVEELIDD